MIRPIYIFILFKVKKKWKESTDFDPDFWQNLEEHANNGRTIEYYNKYAKRYEATLDKTHTNIILDYSAVKLKEGMVDGKCIILDVACGSVVTGIALQKCWIY